MSKWDNDKCNEFARDMEELGLDVEHYHGRFSWEGPAVRIGGRRNDFDLQDVIRATKVKVQTDQMGLGLIVYPVASGRLKTLYSQDGTKLQPVGAA